MTKKTFIKAKMRMEENVKYTLKDKNGNIKKLFAVNALGGFLLAYFRKINLNPINEKGLVKSGILNYLSAYGLRIPFITGMWSDSLLVSNLITNAGAAGVASRINGSGGEAAFTYIAVGTGTNAAAVTDTTLQTEITDSGLARVAATASRVTTDVTNDTAQLQTTFTVSGTKSVTESGVLNAGSGGVLLNRQVFSAINVVSGDSLQVTHKFDVD